jgi:hypothetical protein
MTKDLIEFLCLAQFQEKKFFKKFSLKVLTKCEKYGIMEKRGAKAQRAAGGTPKSFPQFMWKTHPTFPHSFPHLVEIVESFVEKVFHSCLWKTLWKT